jgi:hypothetical protein
VESIEGILDSLGLAVITGRSCKKLLGSKDQGSPGFFDAQR